jgi:hypothetical protein
MKRSSLFCTSCADQHYITCDNHFFKRRLCHDRYCLVFLDVEKKQVAEYVRLLLKHPTFDTQAKRMGKVIRASHAILSYWQLHLEQEQRIGWIK